MKNFGIALLFFFLIGFSSCERELIISPENTDSPLLTKEIFSEELYIEYTWNNQNLVSESKSKYFYTSYTYDSNNQLTSYDMYEDSRIYSSSSYVLQEAMNRQEWVSPENTEISGRGFYTYKQGKLAKIEVQRFLNDSKNFSEFEQDENGRISKQTFFSEEKPSGYIEYQYDNSGNLILRNQFYLVNGKEVLSSSTTYEFDDKKNPFKAFQRLLIPGRYTNENNIVKETLTLAEPVPGVDQIQVTESVYEYNDLDYPVLKDNMIRYEYK
ncbi:MAG: hypothetical protein WAO52_02045 [Prolixibacteraceae bacterium]